MSESDKRPTNVDGEGRKERIAEIERECVCVCVVCERVRVGTKG